MDKPKIPNRENLAMVWIQLLQNGERAYYKSLMIWEATTPYLVLEYSMTEDIFIAHEKIRLDPSRMHRVINNSSYDYVYHDEIEVPPHIRLGGGENPT